MEKTWRWFGPADPVPLAVAQQAGATGIVSALHHLPNGVAWPLDQIRQRKAEIEAAGLRWSVVESVPVHEDIKLQRGPWRRYLENYGVTLQRLAQCGIRTVCYNFMPVLDWTRTDLHYRLPDGGEALRFDRVALALFDLWILKRPHAEADYTPEIIAAAEARHKTMTPAQEESLTHILIAGLPGAEEHYTLADFRRHIDAYAGLAAEGLRQHLIDFMRALAPIAQATEVKLAIHPDDPPFSLLGLPRVVGQADDLRALFTAVPDLHNGLTFCTGSLGARADNDLLAILEEFGERVHFLHLRNVQLEPDGSFYEADHLNGSADMQALVRRILQWQQQRKVSIPMRPDHGHRLAGDFALTTSPGYTAVGRLKGLAQLTGLEMGIMSALA
jgi:mannonate dehydratase